MSLSNSLPFRLETVRFPSGVRRAFLVSDRGLPEWYSTLYVTMRLRNAGLSVATQEAVLNAVNVLYAHASDAGLALFDRFTAGQYLDRIECEALRRSVQFNFGPESKRQASVVALGRGKKGHVYTVPSVAQKTQVQRLMYIARFVEWLGHYTAGDSGDSRAAAITAMRDNILALRPAVPYTSGEASEHTFTRDDDALLCEIIAPGASRNPFRPEVQVRNALLIELLRLLGKRRGEVLNIRVGDIDLAKRQINIIRRADDKHDTRVNQPRVKTLTHTVPIGPTLVGLIDRYLVERRNVPGATKQPYLLVTHKSGPTRGGPMTIEALKEVFRSIKRTEPRLTHLHPHLLRHFNSTELARAQLENAQGLAAGEVHRRERNHLAGRSPESEVDSLYTRQETERRAKVHALRAQETMSKRADEAVKAGKKGQK